MNVTSVAVRPWTPAPPARASQAPAQPNEEQGDGIGSTIGKVVGRTAAAAAGAGVGYVGSQLASTGAQTA
ncbi:MAG: hypothetical protein AB1758_36575, partial [Candidatus Eremiobacterota bacterium]